MDVMDNLLQAFDGEKRLAEIRKAFDAGKTVNICTYTRITRATAKHADLFFVSTRTGHLMMRRGKKAEDLTYCTITFS